MIADLEQYATDPAAFADAVIPLNEKGRPWRLNRYQRRVLARAFRRDAHGELLFRLILWSETKKSGKTFLAAVLVLWWAFTNADTEIKLAANDLEQSTGRVFRTVDALCKKNPDLAACVTIKATEIQVSNGTLITAIASEYRGAAGSRHSLAVFDELWGYSSEDAQRLYEELTPPPTEENAWTLVVTYAGFTAESVLLETMYKRGLAGERVDDELEMYEADGLFMFWSHTQRQPWQMGAAGERYYAEQARSLRAPTFARLHRNEWVSAVSVFVTPELWDGATDDTLHPLLPMLSSGPPLFVGVDAGIKHDSAAVVAVRWDGERLALALHRIWRPTPANPLDLEATIEAYLRELRATHRVTRILCDPYQLHRSITALAKEGLPIEEFPQTVPNTTRMGQTLFDLLNGRNLRVYPAADVREQALATVAVESPRGFRIAKEKASKKIDVIVALAMACVAAIDGKPRSVALGMPVGISVETAPHLNGGTSWSTPDWGSSVGSTTWRHEI